MCTDVRSTEILGKIACKSTVQMKNDDIGTPVVISIKSAWEVHSLSNPICSVCKTQIVWILDKNENNPIVEYKFTSITATQIV